MIKVPRLLLVLLPLAAFGCMYPDLKMGTGSGGATTPVNVGSGGSSTKPAGAGGSSARGGSSATGGVKASGGVLGSGGVSGQGGASTAATCAGTLCDGVCKDTATDSKNCGQCGKVCSSGQRCSAGACICDYSSCSQSCCSANTCVVTQTAAACGVHGEACSECGPKGTSVTFNSEGRAFGAMTGYGWVNLGAQDTITSPTCEGRAITSSNAYCPTGIQWNSASALCVTGTLPALSASNPDYTNNWGLSIGVDATLNKTGALGSIGQTLGQPFTTILVTLSGSPLSGLRLGVHRHGDADGVEYCAPLTPGIAIPFTSLLTECYKVTTVGTRLTAADVLNIDQITVEVPSTFSEISVSNLCITSITFGTGPLTKCASTAPGGGCVDAGYLNCGAKCCPPSLPYHCSSTSTCYATEGEAVAACGSVACSTCVATGAAP